MDFPKNLGDGWSGPGRTKARSMAGDDVWLRARRFGAEARNKGGHLVVRKENPPPITTDGYYSLGDEGEGAVVRGSPTATGTFTLRGGGPFGGLQVPQIIPFGGGQGMMIENLGDIGIIQDEWGLDCRVFSLRWYLTRDGRDVDLRGTFDGVIINTISSEAGGGAQFVQGAYWDGAYGTCWAFDTVDESGIHFARMGRDHGGNITYHTIWKEQGYFPTVRGFSRLGPRRLLAHIALIQPEGLLDGYDGVYDAAITAASFFMYSDDAGDTWSRIDPALTAEEMETFDAIKTNISFRLIYNAAARWSISLAVPLTGNSALVYQLSPLIQQSTTEVFINVARANVTYGVFTPGAISKSGVLYQAKMGGETGGPTTLQTAYRFYERQAVQAPGGGALLSYNESTGTSYGDATFKTFHTTDGVALNFVADSPVPARRMGLPLAVSSSKLFCPIYDGERALYESSDLGATWTKRATISPLTSDPVPPSNVAPTVPQDFGVLTFLRQQGQAANTSPGAPWVGDERITAP